MGPFRVQMENGLENIFFLYFSPVSIQKKDDSECSISGRNFFWHSELISKGTCTTVMVFGNVLSMAVHSSCKLSMLIN